MKSFLALFFIGALQQAAIAGPQYPEIGKPCPDFVLNGIQYYKKTTVSLSDFKGQWLILDFWNQFCSGCIHSMPHNNELQQQFKGRLQFMLVAWIDRPGSFRPTQLLYERIRKIKKLELPVVYDSTLANTWDLGYLPYMVVIDPAGIVRAIALGLTAENLEDIMSGKTDVQYPRARNWHTVQFEAKEKYKYNPKLPLFVKENGGPDTAFLCRSILAKWNPLMPRVGRALDSMNIRDGIFQVNCASLSELYNYAYINKVFYADQYRDTAFLGKFFPAPVFEINDSSLLKPNYLVGENLYAYSITLPKNKANVASIQKAMQHDLENWFGYQVDTVERMMPCYELTATEAAKIQLRTKGGTPSFNNDPNKMYTVGYRAINHTVTDLISGAIISHLPGPNKVMPVFDCTGIQTNIDISINAIYFQDLVDELHKNGLELKEGRRKIKVVLVKERS